MRVVLYLRRSTVELQPDSLAAQEEILRRFAGNQGHEVIRCYRDSASGRFVKGRDAFQELIEKVRSGPDFEAVLVRDVSRWSRAENTDEAGYYEFLCRSHGVQVVYVEEAFGPGDSPYGLLMKSLKRTMAAEFSREKSRMVSFAQARVTREGFVTGGTAPFGMRRMLVDETGKVIRAMAPGERKALSSHRIKLAPGDPEKIAIVRRIFETYAIGGAGLRAVVVALNAECVPSSRGSIWTAGMVSHVLRNEAYAGNVVYRSLRGDTKSLFRNLGSDDERISRCEEAHEAIIPPGLWKAVQERMRATGFRLADGDLLEAIHCARGRWKQPVPMGKESVTGSDLRAGYGRPDPEIIGKALPRARTALRGMLASHFHLTDLDGGLLLDHLVHVGFAVSLPHARFGGLHWSFDLPNEAGEDVVLGLGFSPPPLVRHVETFFFRTGRRHPRRARPILESTHSSRIYHRLASTEEIIGALQRAFRWRGKRAEGRFKEAIRGHQKISLKAVAAGLDWPVVATRSLYRKLSIRGEALPPLRSGRGGPKVRMTCPHCLRVRQLGPKVAISLETDVCFECLHRPPVRTPNKLVAVCPKCGKRRLLWPSDVAARRGKAQSLCGQCSSAANRSKGITSARAQKGIR